MTNPQVYPKSFGWLNGRLILTEPQHLISRHNQTPHVIPVDIPKDIVKQILTEQLETKQVWKVYPETYPVNGIVSKLTINERPNIQDKNKDGQFFIVGTVIFRCEDKFRVLIRDEKRITVHGKLSERYKLKDTLYIKAIFDNRQLHLLKCCTDLDYLITKKSQRVFSFTLHSYPELISYSALRGIKQFWAPYGSGRIAVIINPQKGDELEILKSGQYIAHISGKIENISGIATLSNPVIKTEVKLFDKEDELFLISQKEDSPRVRILGSELAY